MSQPSLIIYSAADVDKVPMLPDNNDFTGINKFGSSTEYIQIDASGELTMNGDATVWDDLPPTPITSSRLGATAPTLATFVGNVEQYTFDATNDYVIGATELTHAWKEGSVIHPHIHWATNGVDAGITGVKWQLEYTIGDSNEAFGSAVTLTVDTTIPASTPDRTHYIKDFSPTIDGANNKIGAYICWTLTRIASASSAPAADPFALAVGFHVECDTLGSKTATSK